MRLTILFLFISTILFSQGPVDGYMKKNRDFSVGLSVSRETATVLYQGTEPLKSGRNTMAYSVFGIYGISDRINVQANIPYLNVNKGKVTDFQDFSLYFKYLLLSKDNSKGKLDLMAATGLSQPLGEYVTSGSSAIGQMAITGDGRLIAQQNFNNNFFASLQAGYFLKTDPIPNSVSSSLKIGYAGKFYADVWYEFLHAFGGTDYLGTGSLATTSASGGFRGLGFSYNKIGGTVYYAVSKHFGVFGGASYILSGRNAFKNTGFNLGFVFQ
jgi:hypothetical protein